MQVPIKSELVGHNSDNIANKTYNVICIWVR